MMPIRMITAYASPSTIRFVCMARSCPPYAGRSAAERCPADGQVGLPAGKVLKRVFDRMRSSWLPIESPETYDGDICEGGMPGIFEQSIQS